MTDYHWTPANQRAFLEYLSKNGRVEPAAKAVNMSREAAYSLRRRGEGAAFALGWKAAILLARERLEDDLLDRALAGQEDELIRDPDGNRAFRKRIDNRLGMGMLNRLDRMAGDTQPGVDLAMAQLVAGDFERFLDMLEQGGGGTGAAIFLATRQKDAPHCQLPQFFVGYEPEKEAEPKQLEAPPAVPPTPEEEAAAMSVWWDEIYDDWRTDFPPPDDFYGEEELEFGQREYNRALSEEEVAVQRAANAVELAPLRAAAEAARKMWFEVDEAVQAELDREAFWESKAAEEDASMALAISEPVLVSDVDDSEPDVTETEKVASSEVEEAQQPVQHVPFSRQVRVPERPYYGLGGAIPPWAERVS